jgi:hypothetical protein
MTETEILCPFCNKYFPAGATHACIECSESNFLRVCQGCQQILSRDQMCECGYDKKIEQPVPVAPLKSYRAVVREITITEYEADTDCYNETELRDMIKNRDWHIKKRVIKEIKEIKIGAVVETEVSGG